MATQIGPFEIIDPIIGPPARGSLLGTVEHFDPTVAPTATLHRIEAELDDARQRLSDVERTMADVLKDGVQEPPTGAAADTIRGEIAKLSDQREVAAVKVAESRRWENGATWRPLGGCAQADTWAQCSGVLKLVDPTAPLVEVVPFTVYAGFTCSTWALAEEERIAHAEIRLSARESQAIEEEMWKGSLAQANAWPNPFLAGPATTKLTAGASTSPYPYALGNLQDALAECLGSDLAGVIHAPRSTVTLWQSLHMVSRGTDGRIRDLYGNLIVAGGGYDGSSPSGVIDATGKTAWAYATGPVKVITGPVYITPDDTAEAVDRSTNDITWRAERTAIAAYDPCCVFGINVDRCATVCAA